MGGVVGRVFREFAVTISCAILVSGFVSLTLTPMLCARILQPVDHHAKQNLFYRVIDFFIDGMTTAYRVTLDFVLRWRFAMLLVTFATFYASMSLFVSIPKGFFPVEDTGFLIGATEIAAGTGFPLFAAASAADRRDPYEGSGDRLCDVVGGPGRSQSGQRSRRPQAEGPTRQPQRDHVASAPFDGGRSRHQCRLSALAEPQPQWRARLARALPIYASGNRSRTPFTRWRHGCWRSCSNCRCCAT